MPDNNDNQNEARLADELYKEQFQDRIAALSKRASQVSKQKLKQAVKKKAKNAVAKKIIIPIISGITLKILFWLGVIFIAVVLIMAVANAPKEVIKSSVSTGLQGAAAINPTLGGLETISSMFNYIWQ